MRKIEVRWFPILVVLVLCSAGAYAADCTVGTTVDGGGMVSVIDPSAVDQLDAELGIDVDPELNYVRLSNSELFIEYKAFVSNQSPNEQYAIRTLIVKDTTLDQQPDYLGAGSGIGTLHSATITYDGDDAKTVRMVWNRWDPTAQTEVPNNKIIRDITIFPNTRYVKIDYIDMQWAINIADLLRPGGTSSGVHVTHGGDQWPRGYITHEEPPNGLYYSRYPGDGVYDPADGGVLNYNGHFITAVYNPNNGEGFGRVLPVADTHVIKLLHTPGTRRGLEFQNHPFLVSHAPFTGYMYVFTEGETEALEMGRQLVDQVDTTEFECGTPVEIGAMPYTGWSFADWGGDLLGAGNPTTYQLDANANASATFTMLPGLYNEDFDGYAAGAEPAFWTDTDAGGSLTPNAALFSVASDGDGSYLATTSTATNIHSHLDGVALEDGYEFTGRLRMTAANGGIGVTAFSRFPGATGYYRLRRFGSVNFQLTADGTSFTGGTTQSSVRANTNEWYRFRVRVEDTGTQTEVKANVWRDGSAEPGGWQMDAVDASPSRLTAGTVGVWTFSDGEKHFDELAVHSLVPPAPTLPLTTIEAGNGTIARDPDQPNFALGDKVRLTATPDAGWRFSGWSGDVQAVSNPLDLSISGPLSVTANFVEIVNTSLTTTVIGNGVVDRDPDLPIYQSTDVVSLTAIPFGGWGLSSWAGDVTSSDNPLVVDMTSDVDLTATFVPLVPLYDEDFDGMSAGDDPAGWSDTGALNDLNPADDFAVRADGGNLYLGTTSTATNIHSHLTNLVVPGSGYQFTGRMRIGSANGGIGVTFFSQFPGSTDYYRLRRYGSGSFHLTPTGSGALIGQTDSGVVPAANQWHRFVIEVEALADRTEVRARVWRDGDPEPAEWQIQAADTSPSRLTSGVVGLWSFSSGEKCWDDLAVRALATGDPVTYTLTTGVVGNGTLTRSETLPEYIAGTTVTLTATPDTDWRFVGWQGDLSGTLNPADIQILTDQNVTAVFEEIVQHTVNVSTTGMGSVNADPDRLTYDSGTRLTLTAVPDVGWLFDQWTGDAPGTDNPLVITVTDDLNVTAEFLEITQHPIAVTIVGQGAVVRSPDQATYDLGSDVTLTALADPGWRFDGWTGNVTGNTNPLMLTIAGDVALTATFVEQTGDYSEDFQSYGTGENPSDWLDTAANNGLGANDSLFSTSTQGANTYFGTNSTATNIHSHLNGIPLPVGGYRYSGRMRITDNTSGIGVTFFSQFPSEAAYYRLRRYFSGAFHISPVGTTVSGDLDTGVVPTANTWNRFVIEVEDDGLETQIRAKVWPDGGAEPVDWQAEATDASATRLVAGTVGAWTFHSGSKQFDDLTVQPLGPPPPPPTDLVLSVSSTGDGGVAIVPDKAEYIFGESVQLTATADAGWQFAGWSGDAGGSDNPLTVTMTDDLTIVASFIDPSAQFLEDFESYAGGDDPTDWVDTASGNSLQLTDRFSVADLGGNLALQTTSVETNIHSHHVGLLPSPNAYEFTGRLQITSSQGGIGVTFFSEFPGAAAYYRLRRYFSGSFHISPLGTTVTGTTDTGVVPQANRWYRFKIQVEETGSETAIRARVWEEGTTEPTIWQADCVDNSPGRLRGGGIGTWSFHSGSKRWDDFQVAPLVP